CACAREGTKASTRALASSRPRSAGMDRNDIDHRDRGRGRQGSRWRQVPQGTPACSARSAHGAPLRVRPRRGGRRAGLESPQSIGDTDTRMQPILVGRAITTGDGAQVHLLPRYGNRHGLVAGATGTGKTVTLMTLAEGFSRIGVPVFMADRKGVV